MNVRSGNFQILDSNDIENLRTIREISSGESGRVLEVGKEEKLALKVMHIEESRLSSFKEFISEYEKFCYFSHPIILRALSIFLSDEKKIHSQFYLNYANKI